jgi:hypothetical protein
MLKNVTIRDIAEAAGVSHTAVLKVLNGRHAGVRISAVTRDRILAIVRQSGYRPNRVASDMALGRHTTLGLVMAPGGPDASSVHLAAIESVLAAAGYRLTLIVLPADPGAARNRVTALLHDGVAGLLCAPSIWSVAAQIAAGTCPVIAMGQGAGETILKALGVEVKEESRVESPESRVESRTIPPPATPASSSPRPAIEPAKPAPPILKPLPPPAIIIPVYKPPTTIEPVIEPNPLDGEACPSRVPDPANTDSPSDVPASTPVSEPIETPPPVIEAEPAIPEVTTLPPVSAPIITPEPVAIESPPTQPPETPINPEPVMEPNPLEGEACPSRVPDPAITDSPPDVPASTPISEPIETPPPVIDTEPTIPEVTILPPVSAPIITPEPVVIESPSTPPPATPINPEPVIEPNPLEGEACPSRVPEPAFTDSPSDVPASPPVSEPIETPPPVSAIPSTTQQPDNLSTSPAPNPPADAVLEDGSTKDPQAEV